MNTIFFSLKYVLSTCILRQRLFAFKTIPSDISSNVPIKHVWTYTQVMSDGYHATHCFTQVTT